MEDVEWKRAIGNLYNWTWFNFLVYKSQINQYMFFLFFINIQRFIRSLAIGMSEGQGKGSYKEVKALGLKLFLHSEYERNNNKPILRKSWGF